MMTKKCLCHFSWLATAVALAIFACLTFSLPAYAAEGAQMQVEENCELQSDVAELQQASSVKGATTDVQLGSGVVGTKKFTINQQDIKSKALECAIYWRKDALNDGNVKFNGLTVKQRLKTLGISEAQYLNPTWSNALERIAVQRAIEAGDSSLGSKRPNGTSWNTATYQGIASDAEMRTWSSDNYNFSIVNAFDAWGGEKSNYLKQLQGTTGLSTSGYTSLVDPRINAFGFAIASGYTSDYVAVGEASYQLLGSTSVTNWKGEYSFDMAISNSLATNPGVNVNLFAKAYRINIGSEYTFSGTLAYRNGTFAIKDSWYSTDSSVLQVQTSGKAKALKEGSARVYLLGQDSTKIYVDITVPKNIEMYRLYNKWSGEHLYSSGASERDSLVSGGWTYENVAWNAPQSSKTPVYRLYNKYTGDHHYTTNSTEYNSLGSGGWNKEGIAWYSDDAKGVPVYRLFNRYVTIGTHHFTTDVKEYNNLGNGGWSKEGIAWYGVK